MIGLIVLYLRWFWELVVENRVVRYAVLFGVFLLLVFSFILWRWWAAPSVSQKEVDDLTIRQGKVEVERELREVEANRVDGRREEVESRIRERERVIERIRRGESVVVNVNVNGEARKVRVSRGISVEEANRIRCEVYPEDVDCR